MVRREQPSGFYSRGSEVQDEAKKGKMRPKHVEISLAVIYLIGVANLDWGSATTRAGSLDVKWSGMKAAIINEIISCRAHPSTIMYTNAISR